jgi:acetoacetyl-CoA synthetase
MMHGMQVHPSSSARAGAAPLWTPSPARVAATSYARFAADLGVQPAELPAAALADLDGFWSAVWDRCGVVGDRGTGPAFVPQPPGQDLRGARCFPGARLNVAENLLAGGRRPGAGAVAVVAMREDGVREELTWDALADAARSFAGLLRSWGVGPGDRVAAWLPNRPATLVAMLGTAWVGAVFTSTSPDFGPSGVLDRFGQVAPKVLLAADGYVYGGKRHDRLALLPQVVAGFATQPQVVVVPELGTPEQVRERLEVLGLAGALVLDPSAGGGAVADPGDPVRLPFDAPGAILYSSGTTGVPKCIVHRGAGVLLKHLTEHQLHCDVRPGDRVFYYTTCGWMMWNWLVGALAGGATIVLFDGSPFHPAPDVLWDLAEAERVSLFGTSAKYLDAAAKAGLRPRDSHDLAALRTVTSTGSPLSPEGFGYVYDAIAPDVHLASISGGTDICGCFVLGDPTRPVHAGAIQTAALGMAVDVWDEQGRSLADRPGVRGELVCTAAFPSMPLEFFGDPDGAKYSAAYFEGYPGVWTHGDFASRTAEGGFVIHGRSDATLNAGGVRIGTAELYRQVEQFDEVFEALAVGQEHDGDTRIVLFVRLAPGAALDDDLRTRIRQRLRTQCSPRHVPAVIVAVADLPRTRSGKLAELAVADVVHGRPVRNAGALANPESLELFVSLPQLRA